MLVIGNFDTLHTFCGAAAGVLLACKDVLIHTCMRTSVCRCMSRYMCVCVCVCVCV